MKMHKKLLASRSPELDKHVNNEMKEGIEGTICLPDEEEEVLTLFTEWAYTGDYNCKDDTLVFASAGGGGKKKRKNPNPNPNPNSWPILHKHLQLCVFADKFNVPILQQLAESKFYTKISLVTIEPNCSGDVSGLFLVIGYAYDNLPSSDPILQFLVQYVAWKLELLRETTSFNDLVLSQPDFLKELLRNLNGPKTKPLAPKSRRSMLFTPVGTGNTTRASQPRFGLPI